MYQVWVLQYYFFGSLDFGLWVKIVFWGTYLGVYFRWFCSDLDLVVLVYVIFGFVCLDLDVCLGFDDVDVIASNLGFDVCCRVGIIRDFGFLVNYG